MEGQLFIYILHTLKKNDGLILVWIGISALDQNVLSVLSALFSR